MDYKDYYKILNVSKTATADEIKKSYRAFAIKYHPDKNQNNKLAEEKFKEINEANSILSDVEKRKKYDELSENWQQNQNNQANYNNSTQSNKQYSQSTNQQYNENDFSDFFESMFGGGSSRNGFNQKINGEDYTAEMTISLEEAFEGTTRQIELHNQKLQLTIKQGVKDLQILRLKSKGGKGQNGGLDGDVLITVKIPLNKHFIRKEDDLYCDIKVDAYTAILGGTSKVTTLKKSININISKETENGKILRLKGMGMPKYNSLNEFGDLYAKVNIVLPKNIQQNEIELLKELQIINNTKHAYSE